MKYYVIYASKDIGWYRTTDWVVCITDNEKMAKDFCKKFDCNYTVEEVGEERTTPIRIGIEPKKGEN